MPAEIDIHVIQTHEELKLLKGEWNHLLRNSGADCFFLTYEWLATWWEVFGKFRRLFVMIARKGEKVIGIAPMMITRMNLWNLMARRLEFIGTGESDYQDFIISENRDEVLKGFLNVMLEHSAEWDILYVRNLNEDSPNISILRKELKSCFGASFFSKRTNAAYLPLEVSWDLQLKKFKKNLRSDLSKRRNRIKREGHFRYVRISHPDELESSLSRLYAQHQSLAASTGRWKSKFSSPRQQEFMSKVSQLLLKNSHLHFTYLEFEDEVVSIHYGFLYQDKLYFYIPTFDCRFGFLSPGKLLIAHLIESSCAEGLSEFDFLVGDEEYKQRWTSRVRDIYHIYAVPRRFYAFLVSFWLRRLKPQMVSLVPFKLRPYL